MLNPNFRDILSTFNAEGVDDLLQFSITDLESPDVVIQIGVSPERIDVLTSIDGVDFNAAWRDRVAVNVDGLKIQTLSRQHLITNKRAAGRPQDLADAARLSEMR